MCAHALTKVKMIRAFVLHFNSEREGGKHYMHLRYAGTKFYVSLYYVIYCVDLVPA